MSTRVIVLVGCYFCGAHCLSRINEPYGSFGVDIASRNLVGRGFNDLYGNFNVNVCICLYLSG